MEGGRKKGRMICTSKKKKHTNLLGYRNKPGQDLLAFLFFPYAVVHFTPCPFAAGRCGAEPLLLKGSCEESANRIPPPRCCPAGVFLEQKTKWLALCQ